MVGNINVISDINFHIQIDLIIWLTTTVFELDG